MTHPANTIPPPEDLVQAVIRLGRRLRSHGAGTTLAQTLAAVEGLRYIDVRRSADVKQLLRVSLISTREGLDLFDYLYHQVFSPEFDRTPPGGPQTSDAMPGISPDGATRPDGPGESNEDPGVRTLAAAGSLSQAYARRDFARLDSGEVEAVLREVRRLSKVLAGRIKHRLGLAGRAVKLDFRRTMRASLETGGEPISLVFRAPKPKPRRLVLLCDVSASMDLYTRFFLTFIHGLSDALPRLEAFLFSTRLVRITRLLRETPDPEIMTRLGRTDLPFSGGTDIGGAIETFLRNHRAALVGRRTIFIIISDGWDRGDPAVLDRALGQLRLHGSGIVWLNPLAADPNYEPLAKGMAAAKPHLAALLPFARLTDIHTLAGYMGRAVL